uniref:Uncharacterized protein n=1 Tax=Anguilla anguilla TaxID=7936 RepID=A0A0E9XI51_ANGAN
MLTKLESLIKHKQFKGKL